MHLKTTALLKLALYFATLCPTQASESNSNIIKPDEPKSNLPEENFFFLMFPPEMQSIIASSEPGTYGRLLEAFPEWEGFHHLDLKYLAEALKKEFGAKTLDKDAGVYALRLLSPVPVDPKNLEIMKFPPSSVFNLINFLSNHYEIDMSKSNFIFIPFASSPQFNEWYKFCTDKERKTFREYIVEALLIVGKIDTAFSESVPLKCIDCPAFWAFLQDDVNRFDEIKSTLSKYITLNDCNIISTAIAAKAKNILRTIFDGDLKEFQQNEIETFIETAMRSQDVDIISTVVNKFSTRNIDLFKMLQYLAHFPKLNLQILDDILQKIEYKSLDDNHRRNLLEVMKSVVFSENAASFEFLYDWIHTHDSLRMDQIAVELIPITIRKERDFFIKHLLEKDGTGKYKNSLIKLDPILDCFKDTAYRRYAPFPDVTKYLLTKIDSGAGPEFPIIGSDNFMANELLPFLIKLGNLPSCKIALARNNLGELVCPFIEINHETVKLALEKCPQCLLYFPPKIVNEYIKMNPGCYKMSSQVYAVLTSATNGKPTFSAMERYLTAEYLAVLLTDYENDSEKREGLFILSAAIPYQYYASPRIQSAFTLNTFTPEQYSILMKFWDDLYLSADSWNSHYASSLKIFLSKGEDGTPYCPYFGFTRNVLREPGYLCRFIAESLLQSYQGQLLYGLSLKYPNEEGDETHLLAELPKILKRDIGKITSILKVLFRTDKIGNFILKDVNVKLVQNIVQNCTEEEKWYAKLLLAELENSLPPWAFF